MKRLLIGLSAAIAFTASSAWADSITPSAFSATLEVGESVTIQKTVRVDEGTPTTSKVDVLFLADTTGSMGGSLAAIQASAAAILGSAGGLGDVAFAVAEYKDWRSAYSDGTPYRLNTDFTTDTLAAQAGISAWTASGGNDAPEAQFYALEQAATGATWRADSERIVIWFGDAPGHDPSGTSTEASATAALVAAGISVEAVNVTTYSSWGFDLDTCTSATYCGSSTEGGAATSGQATRITTATGGHLYTGTNDSAIVGTINDAITTAISTYTTVGLDVGAAPAGVDVSYAPADYTGSYDRSVTRDFTFDVTFTGTAEGTYDFDIFGTVDGGRVAAERDHIVVTDAGAPVPAPGTMLLLGAGLLGMVGARRRKAA